MKKYFYPALLRATGLVLPVFLLYGCTENKPVRKKMPGLTSIHGIESEHSDFESRKKPDGFPFYVGSMDLMFKGRMESFTSISIPDADADSLAVNMIGSYKPFAFPLLSKWVGKTQKKVVIDLRQYSGQPTLREDYLIEGDDAFKVPVVFLWDQSSASRAQYFATVLSSVAGIKCRLTSETTSNADGKVGNAASFNCFSADK